MTDTITPECIDADTASEPCTGPAYDRPALSGSGFTYARCDRHYDAYAARLAPILADSPDTDTPPWWWDTSSDETWNDPYDC
ncbi:hypothetical protein LO763_22690 [Glycomyces sp. A-F 0318]|uniref:hypothetical protein n=1 Tax=Glycomyces amatae TaxID=2881355 RepID=UPI001E2B5FCA|nr:hypothetical protein [Glycomyces amatae]MCD0446428.1 hypothetical protein [Glycomyces amatae]